MSINFYTIVFCNPAIKSQNKNIFHTYLLLVHLSGAENSNSEFVLNLFKLKQIGIKQACCNATITDLQYVNEAMRHQQVVKAYFGSNINEDNNCLLSLLLLSRMGPIEPHKITIYINL